MSTLSPGGTEDSWALVTHRSYLLVLNYLDVRHYQQNVWQRICVDQSMQRKFTLAVITMTLSTSTPGEDHATRWG